MTLGNKFEAPRINLKVWTTSVVNYTIIGSFEDAGGALHTKVSCYEFNMDATKVQIMTKIAWGGCPGDEVWGSDPK